MAVWAYQCRQCLEAEKTCFVACSAVDDMPASVRRLRVKFGKQWVCALVDRTRRVDVEGMLVRDAVAAEEDDCAECEGLDAGHPPDGGVSAGRSDERGTANTLNEHHPREGTSERQIQAAIMSVGEARIVVVLVGLELAHSAGEADMFIADLQPRFAGASIVLMGQREDGAPVYYGDRESVERIADLPVDEMPWTTFSIG